MEKKMIKAVSVSGGTINSVPNENDIIKPGGELYSLEIMKSIYPIQMDKDYEVIITKVYVIAGDTIEKFQEVLDYRKYGE